MTGESISRLLDHLDAAAMKEELVQLRAEHDYLMSLAPFQVGDRAVIDREIDFAKARGWRSAMEVLVPGATGVITKVSFSRFGTPGWVMWYLPEVAWTVTVAGGVTRRRYNCHLPSGNGAVYLFRERDLRHACDHDVALERPPDATCWGLSCGVKDHQSDWRRSS